MTDPRRTVKRKIAFCGGLLLSAACVVSGCSSDNNSTTVTPSLDASAADALPDVTTDAPKEGSSCAPVTCSSVGAQCGEIVDGCGGKVDCGATCPQNQVCGGAGANKCGSAACTPKTCAQLGAACGVISDQCEKALDCGGCNAPNTCGGGGTANQCGSSAASACGNGAVSALCNCGSSVVSSGFCCGGLARSKDCMRVRLDGGLVSGTSTFFGKIFVPLLPYLTAGTAYNSNEGITGNYPIAKTDYDALYQNETYIDTSTPAVFTIPVDNGNYAVHLHFVDWKLSKAGDRQFRVDLQGAPVLTDLDIIKEAGKSTALVKSFDVAVSNGAIYLTLTNQVSNAELAAVEILPQGEAHLPTSTATNQDPTVNAGADQTLQSPTTSVTLTGTAADPDGDTLSYAWTKTAGGAATIVSPSAISTQVTGLAAGAYTFTLTVKDGKGGTASDVVTVTVSGSSGGKIVDPAFYVSPSGSDSNAGTSATKPFLTLEKARDAARASTTKTIYLLGGTYNRTATLALTSSQDAGESWLGYPGQTPTLEGSSLTEDAIQINADDVTIRGITFQNFVYHTIFIAWGDARRAWIDSNTIRNTIGNNWSQAAIYMCCGQHVDSKITHNLIDGAGYAGIVVISKDGGNTSGVTIAHNAVYNTCKDYYDCGAIYLGDPTYGAAGAASTKITVENNIVGNYGPKVYNMQTKAIYLDDYASNVTVRNNIVYGSGAWSLCIHAGDNNAFSNNIFDISGALWLALYQAIDAGHKMAGNSFSCNIVRSSAVPPENSLWLLYDPLPGTQLPSVSNNLYWGENGALQNVKPIIDSSPHVANPGFVNPAAANYSFAGGNPAAFCGFQPIDVSQVGPLPNL